MANKIVLIWPPTVMKGTSFLSTQFPLNLASLASSLLKAGYDCEIWDFDVEELDEAGFANRIRNASPFLVGIGSYTPTVINGHRIAGMVKRYFPQAVTVVGGTHISSLPGETMKDFSDFDIGVIGEGEETIVELAGAIAGGRSLDDIKGIVYRQNGLAKITPKRSPIKDLDTIPFPERRLLNIPLYKGQSHRGFSRSFLRITEIMTSRGCPNRCIFCASDVVMDGPVRFRSARSVNLEISECVNGFSFNHFTVVDDTFILKEDRLYEICDEFAKRNVTWNCNARVSPISKKMLGRMVEAGCTGVQFGVESGSPRILKLIKKNITVEQIEDAFRWAREAGLKLVEADLIIGSHPSETREDIDMTRKLLKKIAPDVAMVSIVVPYPGTELYAIMKKNGQIFEDGKWDSFVLFGRKPSWRTDNFSPEDLVSIQKSVIASFYFRPAYMMRMMRKMGTVREAAYWIKGGADFLRRCLKGG